MGAVLLAGLALLDASLLVIWGWFALRVSRAEVPVIRVATDLAIGAGLILACLWLAKRWPSLARMTLALPAIVMAAVLAGMSGAALLGAAS